MSSPDRRLRVVRSDAEGVGDRVVHNVPGNHYDKHGSTNPLVRSMMRRFHDGLVGLASSVDHGEVLDVGCGEGRTTAVLSAALTPARLLACDLEVAAVRQAPDNSPGGEYFAGSVYQLPFASGAFDLAVATEVLEHLDDPAAGVTELVRVARSGVLVTVPNEPWWRLGNMARGAYLKHLGNTPGHVQHWTAGSFHRFLVARFPSVEVKTVAMWNMGLIRL